MINMQFDMEAFREEFREMIREEMREALTVEEVQVASNIQLSVKIVELPAMLTRDQLNNFLISGALKLPNYLDVLISQYFGRQVS